MGANGLFFPFGVGSKNCFGSPHLAKQLLFSMFPSSLTSGFDSILGPFFNFWTLIGYCWGRGRVKKLFWDLLTKMKTFIFNVSSDFCFDSFFTFWGPNGLFLGLG